MGCVQECFKRPHVAGRLLPVREVTYARESRQRGAFQKRCRFDAMTDGDQRILVAPEDRDRRQGRRFVRAVEKVPVLSPSVDDVAHAAREGARGARASVESCEEGDFFVRERAAGRVRARVVPIDMNGCPKRSTKNGNDAHRSDGPTSRPSPPAASSPRRRMRRRCLRSIHCATPPPNE